MTAFIVIATILLTTAGQICLRKFACSMNSHFLVVNSFIVGGLLFYGLSVLTYIQVLKNMRISIAFPVIFGCTSILVSVVANLIFKETLSIIQIVGILVIITGVCLTSI